MEAVLHAKLMERRIQANSNATNANSNLISTTVPGSLAGKLDTTSPIVFNFPVKLPGTVVEIKLELALVALELAWISTFFKQ